MSDLKSQSVAAIKNGTVIDHIRNEATLDVLQILKLKDVDGIVSIAYNLDSKSMQKKGLIKIGGKNLSTKEIQKIAVLAPNCTMSIIENYKVKEKTKLEIPDEIIGVAKCINPNCITNNESVRTKFNIENKSPLKVRCVYCERTMTREELHIR